MLIERILLACGAQYFVCAVLLRRLDKIEVMRERRLFDSIVCADVILSKYDILVSSREKLRMILACQYQSHLLRPNPP